MKNLQYSLYQTNFMKRKFLEGNQNITDSINENIETTEDINENKNEIKDKINDIFRNPGYRLDYEDLEDNKNIKQLENDIHSVMLQDKFVLALGGLTLASLIVLAYKI